MVLLLGLGSTCPVAGLLPLGQPGRYGSGFLVQPVAVRSEGAVARRSRVSERREGRTLPSRVQRRSKP